MKNNERQAWKNKWNNNGEKNNGIDKWKKWNKWKWMNENNDNERKKIMKENEMKKMIMKNNQ